MKAKEIIKIIEEDGWYFVEQKGSHKQYKHPIKKGRVTISGHGSHDMAKGTVNNILKQAGLK